MSTLVPFETLSQSFQKQLNSCLYFFLRPRGGGGGQAFEFISSGVDLETIFREYYPLNLSSITMFSNIKVFYGFYVCGVAYTIRYLFSDLHKGNFFFD